MRRDGHRTDKTRVARSEAKVVTRFALNHQAAVVSGQPATWNCPPVVG